MNDQKQPGIVYVLTNPAMPGLVKIGKTARGSAEARMNELYSTGVPVPFECAYAAKVPDEAAVERAFHLAFGPYRINPKREFFEIEPEQAIALLELMSSEDVTPTLQAEAERVDVDAKEAVKKLKRRRPNMNFIEMDIPVGSILKFIQSDSVIEVISEKKIKFNGEIASLTKVTRELLKNDYDVQPGPYWSYKGKRLIDIYNDTYESV